MINQRLFKHYGIDTEKDMAISNVCPRPFDTLLVDKMGSCYACECTSWLPQSIGNLQIKPLSEIIGSATHRHLQASVSDGTYRYCNAQQCPYINVGMPSCLSKEGSYDRVRHLRLAIDDSCNLRCPSCRTRMIFHKDGSAYRLGVKLADRIIEWLQSHTDDIQVHMGSDGDPFASHVYRHFMDSAPERDNIKYSILTNGLMFKEFHGRVPYVIRNLKELGVSIDGATQDTYEKLRLGGRWDKIKEALDCIREQKELHGFEFTMHFVVQKDNYHEMEDIIHLGQQHGVDRIHLNKIEDWNVMKEYSEHNILDPRHPQHNDYLKRLESIQPYVGLEKNPIVETSTL